MRRMQLGQIVDYCIEVENQETRAEKKKGNGKHVRKRATQEDINAFFGPPRKRQ